MTVRSSRRKAARARDNVSKARRTPRFDYASMRKDARESAIGNELNIFLGNKRANVIKLQRN